MFWNKVPKCDHPYNVTGVKCKFGSHAQYQLQIRFYQRNKQEASAVCPNDYLMIVIFYIRNFIEENIS